MNTYLVHVNVKVSGDEKSGKFVVQAENKTLAEHYAIYNESHDHAHMEWEEGGCAIDMFGEFIYSAQSQVIEPSEVDIIRKYFSVYVACPEQLKKAGNYVSVFG